MLARKPLFPFDLRLIKNQLKIHLNTNTVLSKKSNAGGIIVPVFKLYYRVIEIKTACYWHQS
jgi:hypothetical protein